MEIASMSFFVDKLNLLIAELSQKTQLTNYTLLNQNSFSKTQLLILERLYNIRHCFISELATYLSISLPATTGIIERMTKKELVKKEQDKKDRRMVNIKLTDKGRMTFSKIYQHKKEELIKSLKKLKKKERNDVLKYLNKLGKAINFNR